MGMSGGQWARAETGVLSILRGEALSLVLCQ